MASTNEIVKALAVQITESEHPDADPREEIELVGLRRDLWPLVRTEGTGARMTQFGPRWVYHYHEAKKLYAAIDLVIRMRPTDQP